jgi:hypothetical protein
MANLSVELSSFTLKSPTLPHSLSCRAEIDPAPETKPARPDPIDMDEDEPVILYDWIKEIDGSIPDSVEPSASVEAKEARLIAKIAKKAAKTLQQIKKYYILCPEEHRDHYKTMVRAHGDLSKIIEILDVA